MAKHIFVTGGVVSSLGKGLTCASIGMLLEHRGLRVRLQKFDPYINVDPGTMSPYQHGEVYVLDDGAETDLDLGHYERFTDATLTRDCNYTTGKIYLSVIQKEREGKHYEGRTVQVIPHVTDEIKAAVLRLAGDDVDVVITEIGGTVGDIESLPFLEAIRQFAMDVGRENVLYIHLTLVPYLKAAAELKTKPTQHSVGALRQIGIQPDVLICRTEHPISAEDKDKIALFCNVERKAVIEERDKEYSIYEVPLSLVRNGLDDLLVKRLGLKAGPLDIRDWHDLLDRVMHPTPRGRIAVVGKYMKHRDAYKSVYESLDHAGIANRARVIVQRVEAEDVSGRGARGDPRRGRRDPRAGRVRDARDRGEDRGDPVRPDPTTSLFSGSAWGCSARPSSSPGAWSGLEDANSTEFDKHTQHPVISLMEDQSRVRERGGTMRLGAWPCDLAAESLARAAYGADGSASGTGTATSSTTITASGSPNTGWSPPGVSPDGSLVEILELPEHPWFLSVQFHPEFQSKPTKAHPLFREFIAAALRPSREGTPGGTANRSRR